MSDTPPIIGPVAPPGVRHVVKLKDGTVCVAFMALGRRNVKDGTWLCDGKPVEVDELIGLYRPGKEIKVIQRAKIVEMMKADEELGLYDNEVP